MFPMFALAMGREECALNCGRMFPGAHGVMGVRVDDSKEPARACKASAV